MLRSNALRWTVLFMGSLSLNACGPDHKVTINPNPPALTSIVQHEGLAATDLPAPVRILPALQETTRTGDFLTFKVEALQEAQLCGLNAKLKFNGKEHEVPVRALMPVEAFAAESLDLLQRNCLSTNPALGAAVGVIQLRSTLKTKDMQILSVLPASPTTNDETPAASPPPLKDVFYSAVDHTLHFANRHDSDSTLWTPNIIAYSGYDDGDIARIDSSLLLHASDLLRMAPYAIYSDSYAVEGEAEDVFDILYSVKLPDDRGDSLWLGFIP